MIQIQLKLRLTKHQERTLGHWLWNLTGVWNWAIKKIELDSRDGIYHSPLDFNNILVGHSKRMNIPSHVLQGILSRAHSSWVRCFKKISGKPHMKGAQN